MDFWSPLTRVMCTIVAPMLVILLVSGCDPNQEYAKGKSEGYTEGFNAGKVGAENEGYDKGFHDGVEAVYPGNLDDPDDLYSKAQQVFVLVASVKILILLATAIVTLVGRAQTVEEGIGRTLAGLAGAVTMFILYGTLPALDILYTYLLKPTHGRGIVFTLIVMLSAIFTAYIISRMARYLDKSHGMFAEAMMIFVLSMTLSIVAPTIWPFLCVGEMIHRYLATEILMGVLVGGIAYFSYWFIKYGTRNEPKS